MNSELILLLTFPWACQNRFWPLRKQTLFSIQITDAAHALALIPLLQWCNRWGLFCCYLLWHDMKSVNTTESELHANFHVFVMTLVQSPIQNYAAFVREKLRNFPIIFGSAPPLYMLSLKIFILLFPEFMSYNLFHQQLFCFLRYWSTIKNEWNPCHLTMFNA